MMNLYFLLTVLLYIGGCNSRVVPLNFKPDESKLVDSNIFENELIDESPLDELEILGHSVPDIQQSNDLAFLISEDKNTSGLEISNRNARNLPLDLASEEKSLHDKSNLGSSESLAISDLLEEEFNLTSQFTSKNDSNSKEPLETLQINGTLNDETIDTLTIKNETFITNNSSPRDLEQGNNIEFTENDEEILNDVLDHQNETFAIFEVFNVTNNTDNSHQLQPMSNDTEVQVFLSDTENITDHQNETSEILEVLNGTNNTDNSLQFQPFSNDTEVEVFLNDAENISKELKSNNLITGNLNITNDSLKTTGGILSGFEFLINSEVARNAAKAMEVFNFSDPLTDHIMEENEFHSFLNAEQILDFSNQTDLKSDILITNSSGESNENRADLNKSLTSGEETSMVLNQAESEETSSMLNQNETLEMLNNSMLFNLSQPMGERNETELLNFAELEGNLTSEVLSSGNPEETIQIESEVATSKENMNGSVSNSGVVGVPECPPSGWCIFWFLSQDTCAVNEHCLGSRICCKIRCSKTCIEV